MNPIKESKRIKELRLYNILDTAAEKAYDDLTKVASMICGTPISLVSLVDQDRQWFKSRHGLDATETPRAFAFCSHAIESDELMVVEDAAKDERFANNPLVIGAPNIRFYAGVPLSMENGVRLGTLCVIDHVPRTLSEQQVQTLDVLRDAVVSLIELRRARNDLEEMQRILRMCAWCKKVTVAQSGEDADSWYSVDVDGLDISNVTNGICPKCKQNEFSVGLI